MHLSIPELTRILRALEKEDNPDIDLILRIKDKIYPASSETNCHSYSFIDNTFALPNFTCKRGKDICPSYKILKEEKAENACVATLLRLDYNRSCECENKCQFCIHNSPEGCKIEIHEGSD